MYYIVRYSGPFGFIKPWTAVRDGETFSQQFLTPSIIKGLEVKLFPEELYEQDSGFYLHRILRHRLSYSSVSSQQEQIQAKAYKYSKTTHTASRDLSILKRGILISPILYLAFGEIEDARTASMQHICLCRNEDVLLPDADIQIMSSEIFDSLEGFELIFDQNEESFLVGFNRYWNSSPMYGRLLIQGNPVGLENKEW